MTLAPGAMLASASALDIGGDQAAAEPPAARSARVHCAEPRTLRLRRFEDRSAQVLCGHRVIVRVSVPD